MSLSPQLREIIERTVPKINPTIGNGIVYSDCKDPLALIDEKISSSLNNCIPGISYDGCHWLTPEQEYVIRADLSIKTHEAKKKLTYRYASKNGNTTANIDKNDMRMLCIRMSFNGRKLPDINVLVHYVSKYNLLTINGARYLFSPVLYDSFPSMNIKRNEVFVQLEKLKAKFVNNLTISIYRNKILTQYNLVYTSIFKFTVSDKQKEIKKQEADVNMRTTLIHYLLCKFGLNGMFERYLKLKVGNDILVLDDPNEIERIDRKSYVVYESGLKTKPKSYIGNTTTWTPTCIVFAVKAEKDSPVVQRYIAGVLYVLTHFGTLSIENLNQSNRLMYTLGNVLFGPKESINMVVNKVSTHIESLDTNVDTETIEYVRASGYTVNCLYDLMHVVVENYETWMSKYRGNSSSCYGKIIKTKLYTYKELVTAINTVSYELTKLYKKHADTTNEKKVIDTIKGKLTTKLSYKISKEHGAELSTVSIPTDRPIFSCALQLVSQSNTSKFDKNNKKKTRSTATPETAADSSVSVACSFQAILKSNSTGRAFLNPWLVLEEDRTIRKPQKHAVLLDTAQRYLRK